MMMVCKQTDETSNIDFQLYLHCLYLYGKGQGCNKLLYMCSTFQWSMNLTTDCFGLVWCFTIQSTAMVMLGPSVHITTLFSCSSLTNPFINHTSCTLFFLYLKTVPLESAVQQILISAVSFIGASNCNNFLDMAKSEDLEKCYNSQHLILGPTNYLQEF